MQMLNGDLPDCTPCAQVSPRIPMRVIFFRSPPSTRNSPDQGLNPSLRQLCSRNLFRTCPHRFPPPFPKDYLNASAAGYSGYKPKQV